MRSFRRETGRSFSEGSRLLWLALAAHGADRTAVASKLGVGAPVLHHWLYGSRRPSWPSRMVLRRKLRIPLTAWDQPPTEAFVLPAAAADRTGTDG